MARPTKQPGESRDKLLQVRLQLHEYQEFKQAAEALGLDLSAWVRTKLRDAVRKDLKRYADWIGEKK
jgi:tripartite-type tricarboxylate transporter receptor subunit TctC